MEKEHKLGGDVVKKIISFLAMKKRARETRKTTRSYEE
jgi:hypothetical protein